MSNIDKSQINWFEEVKNNIRLENNISFFQGKIINNKKAMQYNTGEGKTYNSAYLALYYLFYTDKKVVIATTKNDNVEDLLFEIVSNLKKFTTMTENLMPFLGPDIDKNVGKVFLKKININKMVSYNKISKESFQEARIIITNHSYFYNNGDSPIYFNNIKKLAEIIKPDDVIIIDEADEYEARAYINISMNNYYKKVKISNGEMLRVSNNCFSSRDKRYYSENINTCRYELPLENSQIRFSKEGDYETPTYVLDRDGILNIDNIINEFYFTSKTIEDTGRRIGFTFSALKNKFRLLRVYKGELLMPNNISHFNVESEDLFKLIMTSHGVVRVEQIIKLLDPITDEPIFEFDTREDFIKWCMDNMSVDQYDKLLTQLTNESRDLYKRYLIIRRKSILDTIKCEKYFLTATPYNLEEIDYFIENGETKKVNPIEIIDVFFIQRDKAIDKLITNISIDMMVDYKDDINCLAFCAEKRNVEILLTDKKLRYKYKDKKFAGVKVKTGINDGGIDMLSISGNLGSNENYDFVKDFTHISYLNGPEATGKNYKESNLCIINTRPEINAKGRVVIHNNNFWFTDIEVASFRNVIQSGGRIERGTNQKYKSLILVGEDESIVQKYIESKNGNGIKYNFMEDKIIKLGEKNIKNKLTKMINYVKSNINADFEQLQLSDNYNTDNRIKFNPTKILKYFFNLLSNDVTEKEAKKQTMYKFEIARAELNKLIRRGL
jgi:hypothetical protein